MMKEKIEGYFLQGGCNCAEAVLHAADDVWQLGLSPETFRAIGVFGGGICTGETCGALAGAVAALGVCRIGERMHSSPDAREAVVRYVTEFEQRFGSCLCRELKPRYAEEGIRCLHLVEDAAEMLEAYGKK